MGESQLLPAREEPEFESNEDAAEWYGTHDTSGLPPGEPVHIKRYAKSPLTTVAIRLSPREMAELKARASQLSVGYTTYIRMLVSRHVLHEPPLGGPQ